MAVTETLGRHEIKRTVFRSRSGTVYEGWDPILTRQVAIKTVKLLADTETERELARFRRGAQAAALLRHPNIVDVLDYGETNELAYIVMEFVDGPTLKSLLDKQTRFALGDTMRIMEELLAGLQFSHERGVVHRDIKPANVMLTTGGQLKIADFGIARIESNSMTQAGMLLGTPPYMSPEQFLCQVVDARTDIYSSGVLLYELLTGERPFEGGLTAIMQKVLTTEPLLPSQLSVTAPPSLDGVVRRAMAKRPEDRFPSAKAFAAAIRTALAHQPQPEVSEDGPTIVAQRPGQLDSGVTIPPLIVSQPPRRRRWAILLIAAAAAVVVAGTVGGGAWWFWLRTPLASVVVLPPPDPPPPVDSADVRLNLRHQIARWVSSRSCAVLAGTLSEAWSVTLNGLADNRSVAELRQGLTSFVSPGQIDWHVEPVNPVFCPALNALHLLTPAFGDAGGTRLGMKMADDRTRLRDREPIRIALTMPDFTSWLRVDYIVHDGTVQHLYPQLADKTLRIAADLPRTYAPGEVVKLGDAAWAVGEPYGTDLIIAVASSEALFDQPRPDNSETADVYLRDLQSAIDRLRQRNAHLAGAAITVETLSK